MKNTGKAYLMGTKKEIPISVVKNIERQPCSELEQQANILCFLVDNAQWVAHAQTLEEREQAVKQWETTYDICQEMGLYPVSESVELSKERDATAKAV